MSRAKTIEQVQKEKLEAEIAKIEADRRYWELKSDELQRKLDLEEHLPQNRRVFDFWDEVDRDTSFAAVETLSSWASHSKRPITVRFFSYGGSVPSGFALYDFLLSLRKSGITITTVCMGTCMSMGGILLQAGDKRFIGESAMLMIHESSTTYGRIPLRTSEMDDYRSAIRIWEERLSDVLAERSIMTAEQIRERWTRDWFLSSHEAIQLGFADDIAEYPEGQRRGRSARTT